MPQVQVSNEALRVGDGGLRCARILGAIFTKVVLEVYGAGSRTQQVERLHVQQEEGGQTSPSGCQHPSDLREVVVHLVRKQMCEYRSQEHEVEGRVVVG